MNITEMLGGIVNATTQRGNMTKREARDLAAVVWDINNRLEKLEAATKVETPKVEAKVEAPKKTKTPAAK